MRPQAGDKETRASPVRLPTLSHFARPVRRVSRLSRTLSTDLSMRSCAEFMTAFSSNSSAAWTGFFRTIYDENKGKQAWGSVHGTRIDHSTRSKGGACHHVLGGVCFLDCVEAQAWRAVDRLLTIIKADADLALARGAMDAHGGVCPIVNPVRCCEVGWAATQAGETGRPEGGREREKVGGDRNMGDRLPQKKALHFSFQRSKLLSRSLRILDVRAEKADDTMTPKSNLVSLRFIASVYMYSVERRRTASSSYISCCGDW